MKKNAANALRIGAMTLALAGSSGCALADTMVFEAVGTMIGGPRFDSYNFEITELQGDFSATLLDYAFPTDSFDVLSLAISKGANFLGSVEGSGSLSFSPLETGTYTALVFGSPAGAFPAGSYGFTVSNVTAVPETENWALFLTGLGLVSLVIRRRQPIKVLSRSN